MPHIPVILTAESWFLIRMPRIPMPHIPVLRIAVSRIPVPSLPVPHILVPHTYTSQNDLYTRQRYLTVIHMPRKPVKMGGI